MNFYSRSEVSPSWSSLKFTQSQQSFTGGISTSRSRAADSERARARARVQETTAERRGREKELYIRRSAQQKQRSALNLTRTGNDYTSLGVKMRWEEEIATQDWRGIERREREITRSVDGSRLNNRDRTSDSDSNSSSFAMRDAARSAARPHRSRELRILANHHWLAPDRSFLNALHLTLWREQGNLASSVN